MGARDHRTRVTKMLIRRALTQLLGQKPIQSISIKELCQEAGINRGTFYAHYTDIYDLRKQMEDEMVEDFLAALRPLLSAEGEELTTLMITTGIFRCLRDNADVCAMTVGPNGDKEFAGRLMNLGWETYVETYRRFFSRASSKKLEYYYAFVCSGCIGLLEKWLAGGMTTSVEEVAEVAEGIMMRGVECLR